MNARQRFRETMTYGQPDRVPYFEPGLRDDVLERWREQGLPRDVEPADLFPTDRRERAPVDLQLRPPLKKWPTSRRGLGALRRRLDPADPGRWPQDWDQCVRRWRRRSHVLELPVHRGFFLSMGVRQWPRFVQAIEMLADAPALVREIMATHGEFAACMAERVLQEVRVDFASFSEPIGGNDRPLLSPRMYEEFVLPSYEPVLGVLRRHKVATICMVTYANARALVPAVLGAGFNCLWACEVNAEAMDYRSLRREFGRDLRLIGGIDLDALLKGKRAIRGEIESKVRPLLAQGGYVPLADGRIRANIRFENYVHYRRVLQDVVERHFARGGSARRTTRPRGRLGC